MKMFLRSTVLAGLMPLSLLGASSSNQASSSSDNQKKYTITTLNKDDQTKTMSIEEKVLKRIGFFNDLIEWYKTDKIDLCGNKSAHTQSEKLKTVLILLASNQQDDYETYKNQCLSLSDDQIVSLWPTVLYLQVPQKLIRACGHIIIEKQLVDQISDHYKKALSEHVLSLSRIFSEKTQALSFLSDNHDVELDFSVQDLHEMKGIHKLLPAHERINGRNNVHSLVLSGNFIDVLNLVFYKELLPELRSIDLSNNKIASIGPHDLDQLHAGDHLILSNNNLQDDKMDAQVFADQKGYTVDLTGNNLSQAKIDEIRRVATAPNWFARQRHQFWLSGQDPQPLITNHSVRLGLGVFVHYVLTYLHTKLLFDFTPWGKKQVNALRLSNKSCQFVAHVEHPSSFSYEFSEPSFATDDMLSVLHIFSDYQHGEIAGGGRVSVAKSALLHCVQTPLYNKEYRNFSMLSSLYADYSAAYLASLPQAIIEKASGESAKKRISLKLLYNVAYAGIIKAYLKFLYRGRPSYKLTSYKDLLILSTLGTAFEEASRFIERQINTGFAEFKRFFGKHHTPNTIIFDNQQQD